MEVGLSLKDTELCLGLPGGGFDAETTVKVTGKRCFSETHVSLKLNLNEEKIGNTNFATDQNVISCTKESSTPQAKAQVVGWPPVRSFRKNMITSKTKITEPETSDKVSNTVANNFVKVSMDGAPYLRKVDLKAYETYKQLSDALAKMFSSFTMGNYGVQGMIGFINEGKLRDLLNSCEYVPTYEDKDGDWMLVGDVPWEMFVDSCKRMRIMKGSEAIGLAPRATEKC